MKRENLQIQNVKKIGAANRRGASPFWVGHCFRRCSFNVLYYQLILKAFDKSLFKKILGKEIQNTCVGTLHNTTSMSEIYL